MCRLWRRLYRDCDERKAGGQEVSGIVHQVSLGTRKGNQTKKSGSEKKTLTKKKIKSQLSLQPSLIINILCFLAWRNNEVVAAASLNYDPAVSVVAQRLVEGKVITKQEAEYVG